MTRTLIALLLLSPSLVAMDEPTDLWTASLPPVLRPAARALLPESDNAYDALLAMSAEALSFDEELFERDGRPREVYDWFSENRYLDDVSPVPAGAVVDALREVVRSREEELARVHETLARAVLRFPRKRGEASQADDLMKVAWTLSRASTLSAARVRLLVAEGNGDEALAEIERARRLGRAVFATECTLIDAGMGAAIDQLALASVRWLASQPLVPEERLASLSIPEPSSDDVLLVLRGEVGDYWGAGVRRLAAAESPEELALALYYPLGLPEDSPEIRGVRRIAARLIGGHPKPFDIEATGRLAGEIVLEALQNAEGPWPLPESFLLRQLEEELAVWPKALSPSEIAWAQLGAAMAEAMRDAVAEIERRVAERGIEPDEDVDADRADDDERAAGSSAETALSPRALRAARRALRAIDNPLGKLTLVSSCEHLDWLATLHRRRIAATRATRLVVALRRWERRHGALPEALDDLVAAKLLDAVPADPFGPGPLAYSAERRLVWSRGADGKDDDGREEEAFSEESDEAGDAGEADEAGDADDAGERDKPGESTGGDIVWRLSESAS